MLQRVQTVFLSLTIIGIVIFLALPLWFKPGTDGIQSLSLDAFGLSRQITETQNIVQPTYYLVILSVLTIGIALYSIFQYRNRLLQSALCAVNSVVMTVIMGLVIYITFYKTAKLFDPGVPGKYDVGFYGLVGAMLANVFANRFIRRDEKTVQSAKRFR